MNNFGFQRIFLLIMWFACTVLYLLLSHKSSKGLCHSGQAKKTLITFEWAYRHFLIIVIGCILLFSPIPLPYRTIDAIIVTAGILLLCGGYTLFFWARFFLKENWTVGWSLLKECHQLIIGGPYKIVRHPIYLAFLLMILGMALVMLNKYFLVFAVMVGVIAYLKAKSEEKALLEKFGSGYENYKKTVPMLFPLNIKRRPKSDD